MPGALASAPAVARLGDGIHPTVPEGDFEGGLAGTVRGGRVRAELDEGVHQVAPSGFHGDVQQRTSQAVLEVRIGSGFHHRPHEGEAALADRPRQDFLAVRHPPVGACSGGEQFIHDGGLAALDGDAEHADMVRGDGVDVGAGVQQLEVEVMSLFSMAIRRGVRPRESCCSV